MSASLRILLVEDNTDDAELILRALRRDGLEPEVHRVDTDKDLRRALEQEEWDLVLCDWSLPGFDARHALEVVKSAARDLPFVIVSGSVGEETAAAAMRAGADDFLLKSSLTRLAPAIERELADCADRKRRREAERALRSRELILTAVGNAAERLVRAASWEDAVKEILETVGPATGADRILVYQNRARAAGREGLLRVAWHAGNGSRAATNDPQTLHWASLAPLWTLAEETRGVAVMAGDGRLSMDARKWMALHKIRSLSMVPVRTGTVWWGAIAVLEEGIRERSEGEMGALRVLSDALGASIERTELIASLRQSHAELADAYDRTLEGWSLALELRDRETAGHTHRVTDMTVRLARSMGVEGEPLIHIRRGALLHDIGKMGVPDTVLLKPGGLTDVERDIMRLHPIYAYELLQSIPYLRPALDIPYCHHERWDGTGYPRGLAGDEIPKAARIFAVVDVWDAMRSPRPYRDAIPEEEVLATIESTAGTHFDPIVAEAFLRMLRERSALRETGVSAAEPVAEPVAAEAEPAGESPPATVESAQVPG